MRRVGFGHHASLCFVIAFCGCGGADNAPPIAPVSGRVTFQGQPVAPGVVNFASEAGFAASANLDSDGKFRLVSQYGSGIPHGTYKVTIAPPPPAMGEGENPVAPPDDPKIPKKYRDFATTDLKADITDGSKEFSFDLKP